MGGGGSYKSKGIEDTALGTHKPPVFLLSLSPHAIEIRKQRENSKLISSPLKNSIKFSVVYLRVSVTHFVPTGMFKLPPSSRPQISKGNL